MRLDVSALLLHRNKETSNCTNAILNEVWSGSVRCLQRTVLLQPTQHPIIINITVLNVCEFYIKL